MLHCTYGWLDRRQVNRTREGRTQADEGELAGTATTVTVAILLSVYFLLDRKLNCLRDALAKPEKTCGYDSRATNTRRPRPPTKPAVARAHLNYFN